MVAIEARLSGPELGAINIFLCCASIMLGYRVGLLAAAAAMLVAALGGISDGGGI